MIHEKNMSKRHLFLVEGANFVTDRPLVVTKRLIHD
jgi:hypothetical protein